MRYTFKGPFREKRRTRESQRKEKIGMFIGEKIFQESVSQIEKDE